MDEDENRAHKTLDFDPAEQKQQVAATVPDGGLLLVGFWGGDGEGGGSTDVPAEET